MLTIWTEVIFFSKFFRAGYIDLSKRRVSPEEAIKCEDKFTKSKTVSWFLCFLRFYLFLEGKGEKEGEKHQCVVASCMPPTRDLAHNPGMCPDWESTSDPLVWRLALNPLSHTIQALIIICIIMSLVFQLVVHLCFPLKLCLVFSKWHRMNEAKKGNGWFLLLSNLKLSKYDM